MDMEQIDPPEKVASNDQLGQPALIGHMYLARKPCGKVVASCWDDAEYAKDTALSVARWIKRGETIERVARHEGDPQPDWCCNNDQSCACRDAGLRA